MKIPFIDLKTPYLAHKEKILGEIEKVLDSTQFIMGESVKELESSLANYTKSKHAIACSSGTDALMLALMALDIKPNDEVITTPFTFISTAEVIALLGAKPVFVDIDEKTYNMDATKIEQAITSKTKAIMPVSLYGQCADMDAINSIGKKHNIPIIEDAAQSFGATQNGKKSCALSDIGCTSFFPSKPLGCYGDGGAIFTDNEAIATKLKIILNHGQKERYKYDVIGINGRLDTIQAAVLHVKLECFNEEVKKREAIGARYSELLKDIVTTPTIMKNNTHVYAQYTILSENRDALMKKLNDSGIPTAIHYPIPLHLQKAFGYLEYEKGDFPISEKIASKVLSLPMSPYLSEKQQDMVVEAIRKSV